tara:strand:- start:306503 stop:306922 length:420 start_codon:yes stop_codon:yes gene_type:complete
MRNIIYFLGVFGFLIFSCGTQQKTVADAGQQEEPVRIANDSLEYEIIILDIGFNNYLNSIAKPMGFYSQNYLETRNLVYVYEWNNRARNPSVYNSNIYENIIDYQPGVDYGLEVNYKLFNYFQFAQRKYNMRLGSFRVQ